MRDDPELQELFTDPGEKEVVDLLQASRPAAPPLDPHFRNYLRAKLVAEARHTLPARESRPWFGFNLTPRTLVPAMAAVAAGFLVVLGVQIYLQRQPTSAPVAVDTSKIDKRTNVATAEPIEIRFNGPVDKTAVAESVVIEPATSITKQWVGNTLVIIPDHPLAPNTSYTVTLRPTVTPPAPPAIGATPKPTPTSAAPPAPVVVHFTTVRAPAPPVLPPSFRTAGLAFGRDNRLADSGTILSAAWTPTGQLLVARPAGPSAVGPEIWLMSPSGTPIRKLVSGASLPAAAPSGGLFAVWRSLDSGQFALEVRDLQGNLQSTIATIDGKPDQAPVWIGADRIAYVSQGTLRIAALSGPVGAPAFKVDRGSLAASPNGSLLAMATTDGAVVVDLSASDRPSRLPDGATDFAWSVKGDLAFLIQQPSGTDLYVAAGGRNPRRITSSPSGQTWSDLNWAPDGVSLLFASRPASGSATDSRLSLINADGTGLSSFGAPQREYSAPRWSPLGDVVLFTRQDEAGGKAFWTANTTPSPTDAAEKLALAEVDKFMQARIRGDSDTAQQELDDAGRAAYAAGTSSLLSPQGLQFNRYYPVTVQLAGPNSNKFLVGVRMFMTRSGVEASFFEEQLTLVQQDQRYVIDAVKASPTMPIGHGPTVVSMEIAPGSPGQQVRLRFDADLRPDTVTSSTIQVKDRDGNVYNARVTFDPDNHLVTVAVNLRPGNYRLVVTTGVTDINGMPMAQEYDAPLVISR